MSPPVRVLIGLGLGLASGFAFASAGLPPDNILVTQAPIDPRNYGARNFPKLFEAVGLFDIVKAGETGQSYVADRRNKDRAPKPRF